MKMSNNIKNFTVELALEYLKVSEKDNELACEFYFEEWLGDTPPPYGLSDNLREILEDAYFDLCLTLPFFSERKFYTAKLKNFVSEKPRDWEQFLLKREILS